MIGCPTKFFRDKLRVYECFVDWQHPDIHFTYSSNPTHKITIKIVKGANVDSVEIQGNFDGNADDKELPIYRCTANK